MSETKPAAYTLDMLRAHQVYKNASGKRLPGVTTVLGILDKPALLRWAWNLGRDGVDLDKARGAAATIGTVAHARVEAYLRGMEFSETGIERSTLDKSATAFLHFLEWWDARGLAVVETELQLISEAWQVGGTLDILARDGDRLLLVDIKTSNGIYREMRIQASAYAAMYEETHPGKIVQEVWIVRIPKNEDGGPEPIQITNRRECVEAFAALTDTYRKLQAIR